MLYGTPGGRGLVTVYSALLWHWSNCALPGTTNASEGFKPSS